MRFYREMFMKNSDTLRENLLRIPVFRLFMKHKKSLKEIFVKILEELIMKSRKNLENYLELFQRSYL